MTRSRRAVTLPPTELRTPSYRGRFAPSPTGRIHLGTARTALIAWWRARAAGGTFVMRIEDLNAPRVRPHAAEDLLMDLRWLGLDWDEGPDVGGPLAPYVQSERLAHYETVLRQLKADRAIYPCTCSRREIAGIASAPHGPSGAVYPGTCRDGPTHADRKAAWRFRLDEPPSFVDGLAGPSAAGLGAGDFIIARADGVVAYQLAVVTDDAAMGMTEVVRGDDLFESTPRQLALFHALGAAPPRYVHVPLMLGPDGQRLAKRHGATSLAELRDGGRTPEAVVGILAHSLGVTPTAAPLSARELSRSIDPAALHARPPFTPPPIAT